MIVVQCCELVDAAAVFTMVCGAWVGALGCGLLSFFVWWVRVGCEIHSREMLWWSEESGFGCEFQVEVKVEVGVEVAARQVGSEEW